MSTYEQMHHSSPASRGERAALRASTIAACTVFPLAVAAYIARLAAHDLSFAGFNLLEALMLAVACAAFLVASLRADASMVQDAWRNGLHLGCVHADRPPSPDTGALRLLARPCLWRAGGHVAAVAWTTSAVITYLVVRGVLRPVGGNLLTGTLILLALAVCGTVVCLVGPGLTRMRQAYDTAAAIQFGLHESTEVYDCLAALDALDTLDLLRTKRVLEVVLALDALLRERAEADGEQARYLQLVVGGRDRDAASPGR